VWDDQQGDARRSFALAELGRALAAAGSTDEVATIVAERAPAIVGADAGNVGVLRRDGLALDCTYSRDISEAARRQHAEQSLDEHMPHVECVRAGQPLLFPDRAAYAERFPELLPGMSEAGMHATMSWPMFDSSRQVIGVVGYAWKRPTRPDGTAVATIATIGELCAGAIDRTRNVDNRVRTARELTALTNALSTATTTAGVASAVAVHLPRLLDARSATLDVDAENDGVGQSPDGRTLVVPVAQSDPARRGLLVVTWDREVGANDPRAASLGTAAALVGQTLGRVRRSESEHELIASLQEEVLGKLPESLSLDVAATYIPASQTVSIGGDWYDVIDLADGAVAFVIGDVVGHGLSAVAAMTQIRATVRGLVRGGTDPTIVFLRATEMLTDAPTMMATAALVIVDPSNGTVRYASAGHPPALLVQPDGSVQRLDQALQRPLGWVTREAPIGEAHLPVGGGLLLYTDGLVERRGDALDDSIDRLTTVTKSAASASPTARAALDALITEIFATATDLQRTDDDVAVLFVRRDH
jgi:serine phosphatase RsbU (regulator of sigma subunit)